MLNKRKYLPVMLMLALLLAVFSGCGNNEETSAPPDSSGQEVISKELRVCHNDAIDSATDQATHRFAELVAQKTNGQVKVTVYPRNELGGNRELIEQVQMGSLDMTIMGLGTMGYLVEEFNYMQLPFAFRSQEHIHNVVNGEIGKELVQKLGEKGILLLAMDWDRLPRHIAGKRPINSLADLQGLKVREGTPAFHGGIEVLGATPVQINLNEMYIGLQQGVVDAVELPLDYIYNYSIHETADYLSLTYHTYGTLYVAINKAVYESFPADIQEAIAEAVSEAGEYCNELTWSLEEDYMNKLEAAGMEISRPDFEQFTKAIEENISELEEAWPSCKGLFARIQAVE